MSEEANKKGDFHYRRKLPEETREHLHKAHLELRESFAALFPTEFVERRRSARREMLLAARSMLDHAIAVSYTHLTLPTN